YFENFQNTSESSDDSTNAVNAPREPFVVKQDHGVKSSQNPPPIDECCCECGNALDGIFCQQCICKSCGKGAHIGYNCPPKGSIISNLEPCNQTINNELPQTLPSFDSVPCVSKPNFVDESSKIFNPPPQHPIYSCEFCGSKAQNGHYCRPQAQFNNPEQGYSQDFNFLQNIHNFQQQYFCCDQCGGRHETFNVNKLTFMSLVVNIAEAYTRIFSVNRMGDEHLDTIPATESDELIKSSVEDLISIPSEFEGIPDTMCDVHFDNNHTPLEAKDHVEIVINSNGDISSSDDDSLHEENIEYVKASPHDSELVSLEVAEIVTPEIKEIEDDNLREKLLNETNTFHNSLPEFEKFYFDLGEISSGSTTTHSDISLSKYDSFIFDLTHEEFIDELAHIMSGSTTTHYDISLPDYEAFYFDDDHIKEISSGSTTTHSDISLSEYDSFIFKEFVYELAHIISPPEYDRFYFRNLPDQGELMSVLNSGIRENLSTTLVNLPIADDYFPLLAYVVWTFVAYLTHLNEWPMIINGKNTPPMDVLPVPFLSPLIKSSMGGIGSS
nr:hypothetical protein [Tanacetum cinerariifolium]